MGAAAEAVASAVGQQIGLDSVQIEVGDDPSQTRVGTGKYIGQDLFLSYERQLGKEGGNTVGVEYSLDQLEADEAIQDQRIKVQRQWQ